MTKKHNQKRFNYRAIVGTSKPIMKITKVINGKTIEKEVWKDEDDCLRYPDGKFVYLGYSDYNSLSVKCEFCNLTRTKEGYDGCLGYLGKSVANACCGHGQDSSASVQFKHKQYKDYPNRYRISGKKALDWIEKYKLKQ